MKDQLIYEPKLNKDGTYALVITIPVNNPQKPKMKGFELSEWGKFIRIKNSDYQFWYQDLESTQDDVLLYYSSIDNPESHEEIIDFIETNVLYSRDNQHYDVKSIRHVLSTNGLGNAIMQTQLHS